MENIFVRNGGLVYLENDNFMKISNIFGKYITALNIGSLIYSYENN